MARVRVELCDTAEARKHALSLLCCAGLECRPLRVSVFVRLYYSNASNLSTCEGLERRQQLSAAVEGDCEDFVC